MRAIFVFLTVFAASLSAEAQTVTVGPITKLTYCLGDTLTVPYQASGSFAKDNTFHVQFSDANGSFDGYINVGSNAAMSGSISVSLPTAGNNFRVRVASTDPYIISNDTSPGITVVNPPSINPSASVNGAYPFDFGPNTDFHILGITGDNYRFYDADTQEPGSVRSWKFDGGALPSSSSDSALTIAYDSAGMKHCTLSVTRPEGCSSTITLEYEILGCSPKITRKARVVTGTASGSDASVWVKAGGTYNAQGFHQYIFAEAGAACIENGQSNNYYLKPGASFQSPAMAPIAVVLERGQHYSFGQNAGYIDTLFCDSMTFDYSDLIAAGVAEPANDLVISQSLDRIGIVSTESLISVRLFNLLGNEVLSQESSATLDLDLSPLPAGVYFAIVQAGEERVVRRVAVVH